METIFGILLSSTLLCGLYFLNKHCTAQYRKRIYVYPKTKHKYYAHWAAKAKNPDTGEWFDAVTYSGEDGTLYVREREDFFKKFVPLNEWKDEIQSN